MIGGSLASSVHGDFIAGSDAFELERLWSRIAVVVSDTPPRAVWVDTTEHTAIRKLERYRRGGEISDRARSSSNLKFDYS